jgi:hypothetical protein
VNRGTSSVQEVFDLLDDANKGARLYHHRKPFLVESCCPLWPPAVNNTHGGAVQSGGSIVPQNPSLPVNLNAAQRE